MIDVKEGNLKFIFPNGTQLVKLDDTKFYRTCYECNNGAKSVDIVFKSPGRTCLMEIKDFKGSEVENRWRLFPNNKKKKAQAAHVRDEGLDSLDIEVMRKTLHSIVCMYGAWSLSHRNTSSAVDLSKFWKSMTQRAVPCDKYKVDIILFLEGENGTATRSNKMIMYNLQQSLAKKFRWLNCRVLVINSASIPGNLFQVVRC